jgi:hypothetical protein
MACRDVAGVGKARGVHRNARDHAPGSSHAAGDAGIGETANIPGGKRGGSHAPSEGLPDVSMAKASSPVDQQNRHYLSLRRKAEALLVEVMNNRKAPAALRVVCAKTILTLTERQNHQQNQSDDLDPDNLTAESIDRAIAQFTVDEI